MRRKMHQWKMSLSNVLIVSLLLCRTVTSILTDYDLNPPVIHYDLMNPEIWTWLVWNLNIIIHTQLILYSSGISSERVVQSLEDARRVHIISTNKSSIAFVATAGDLVVTRTAHGTGCVVSQTGLGSSFSEINYDGHQHKRKKRTANDLSWFESYVSDCNYIHYMDRQHFLFSAQPFSHLWMVWIAFSRTSKHDRSNHNWSYIQW